MDGGGGTFLENQVNKIVYYIIKTKRHQNFREVTL